MDDTKLAADTHGDILALFQQRLPSNEFRHYVEPLAAKAEGLLQPSINRLPPRAATDFSHPSYLVIPSSY